MRTKRAESGQGAVEAAIAVPILILALLAIMQVCWTSFASSDLEGGISHMQQNIAEFPQGADEDTRKQWVVEQICANSTVLDPSRLSVEDLRYSMADKSSSSSVHLADTARGWLSETRETADRAHLRCTVRYDNTLLAAVPGASGLTELVRTVDAVENARQEFEVR